jgi:hypothetical protein
MKKIKFDLKPMSEAEYTEAYVIGELRNLVTEYRQGVSPERIGNLLSRIGAIKKNGLKSSIEEENN